METDRFGWKTLVPGWPLALFRIAFGLLYLDMAWQKAPWIRDEMGRPFGWLAGFMEKEIANPAFAWYAAFLRDVALPNLGLFGMMTFLTEMALGVALLIGLFTRLAGLAGFLWMVNIAIGGFNVPGEWVWIWPLLTLPQFCFAASDAGRVLGVDHWIAAALDRRVGARAGWAGLLRFAV